MTKRRTSLPKSQCEARTKLGERCRAAAGDQGFCVAHRKTPAQQQAAMDALTARRREVKAARKEIEESEEAQKVYTERVTRATPPEPYVDPDESLNEAAAMVARSMRITPEQAKARLQALLDEPVTLFY